MGLLLQAMQLYERAAPIIANGVSRRFGSTGESWRHLTGWQGVLRVDVSGSSALLIFHSFADPPQIATVPLPPGSWEIIESLEGESDAAAITPDEVEWHRPPDLRDSALVTEATQLNLSTSERPEEMGDEPKNRPSTNSMIAARRSSPGTAAKYLRH